MHSLIKRNFFAVSFIILFFALGILCYQKDTILFSRLTNQFFKEQLLRDTLSMHYTVSCPENFKISSYEATLPIYSASSSEAFEKNLDHYLDKLSHIKDTSLNSENALSYKLLLSYLEAAKLEADFPYYREPLSPSSGSQTQLPILLAEYSFRSKQDVTDYLSLLNQTDEYFAGLTDYEQKKAQAGLCMSDESIQQVIEQCDSIIDQEALDDQTHFLHVTFQERLSTLLEKGVISLEEQNLYLSENDRLLSTVLLPAYEKLADALFVLLGSGNNNEGLYHYPKGQDYYTHLVHQESGSSKSITELKTLLGNRLTEDVLKVSKILQENSNLLSSEATLPAFPLQNPESMLTHLKEEMRKDFPPFPTSETLPSHTVKEVSKSLEEYTSPAFYLTPPLDDVSSNTIYINSKSTPAGLPFYTTLAHEGYPGHLYQSVYFQLYSQKDMKNPVRSLLHYGGYVEGWAFYVETLSYSYAAKLFENQPEQAVCSFYYQLEQLERDMQLCLYSILDIAIHYDGASYEQVHHALENFGIKNSDTTKQIYDYIVNSPANYLKYYVGYLEILSLKEEAIVLWQDEYSDRAFHTFFLESGPCDFETLSNLLKNYN